MGILLVDVEDAIIAKCKAALGNRVREVGSLPSDWDDQMFKRLRASVPGVFVAFTGGAPSAAAAQHETTLDTGWSLVLCTGHASGEAARRRGDQMQIGCYELISILVPTLHGFTIPGLGTLKAGPVNNLFSGAVEDQGLAVYALEFRLPLKFALLDDLELLASFQRFDVMYDVPPNTPAAHPAWLQGDFSASAPDAVDRVTPPQNT